MSLGLEVERAAVLLERIVDSIALRVQVGRVPLVFREGHGRRFDALGLAGLHQLDLSEAKLRVPVPVAVLGPVELLWLPGRILHGVATLEHLATLGPEDRVSNHGVRIGDPRRVSPCAALHALQAMRRTLVSGPRTGDLRVDALAIAASLAIVGSHDLLAAFAKGLSP